MSLEAALPCKLRYSPRATRLRLVVKATGAELVVPPMVGEAQARAFLERHRAWVERKLDELRARLPAQMIQPQSLAAPGATVPFQGRETPVVITESAGRRIRVEFDDGFRISLPAGLPELAEPRARAALFAWVQGWLRDEALRIAARHAARCGLEPGAIRVKRMRTRWGSCGAQGDISLNWLLAFVPPSVLEYVVVHELCHLRQRDHSPAFWNLVHRHLPGWPLERQWLKRQGGELMKRFG